MALEVSQSKAALLKSLPKFSKEILFKRKVCLENICVVLWGLNWRNNATPSDRSGNASWRHRLIVGELSMECDYLRGLSVTLSTLASCSNVQIAPESLALYIYIYINKLNYIVQIHTHILVLVCILCIQLSAQGWVTSRVSSTCRNDRLQTTATATTTNKL